MSTPAGRAALPAPFRALAVLSLALCLVNLGCARMTRPMPLPDSVDFQTELGAFHLEHVPEDAEGAQMTRLAVERAAKKLQRCGRLTDPVTLQVFPTTEALTDQFGRGFEWVRAWSERERIRVASPRSWFAGGATQEQLDELLLHELTHSLMYQRAAPDESWRRKAIPIWFREGMASVTAHQGYRRGSYWTAAELVARAKKEGTSPLRDLSQGKLKQDSDESYTLAHHAFAFLLIQSGESKILRLLDAMRAGPKFQAAFAEVMGQSEADFEAAFIEYIESRRWR